MRRLLRCQRAAATLITPCQPAAALAIYARSNEIVGEGDWFTLNHTGHGFQEDHVQRTVTRNDCLHAWVEPIINAGGIFVRLLDISSSA